MSPPPRTTDRGLEREMLKALHHFYATLETTDKRWKEICKTVEKVFDVIKNYGEQLRHVTSPEVAHAEICKIDGLIDRLMYKIHMGISEELDKVKDAAGRLSNLVGELKNKLMKVENTRNRIEMDDESMRELVIGTAYRPKLPTLLEWSIDSYDYYKNIYRGIIDSLKALDYMDESSIERLAAAFAEPEFARVKIDRILGFTQFVAREIYR